METKQETTADTAQKICIIGSGPIGLGIAKSLKQAGIPFDLIEKENEVGGLWNKEGSCSKVYPSLHLDTPKSRTEYADYPMPQTYSPYPHHQLYLQYLRDYAAHFDLYAHAKFNHAVTQLAPYDEHHCKVVLNNNEESIYRAAIIATGFFTEPLLPHYPGQFSGHILHASDYHDPDILTGKRVLIVGYGDTACDIAVDAAHYAANTIQSVRRTYYLMPKFIYGKPTEEWIAENASQFKSSEEFWLFAKDIFRQAGFNGEDFGLPKPDHEIYSALPVVNSLLLYHVGHGSIHVKPDIKELKSQSVIFADDSEEPIDMIIYATGYHTTFPFLASEYGIRNEDDLSKLFIYMFHRQFDHLLFAGFINTSSGLGSIANATGRLFANYLQALLDNSPALQIFNQLKKQPNPDLGESRYIQTPRCRNTVDVWKLIKIIHILAEKLQLPVKQG